MIATILQNRFWCRCMAGICMLLLTLQTELVTVVAASAAEFSFATSYVHEAPKYVIPGSLITITGKIVDPRGIKQARCYFKVDGEADYLFVPMTAEADDQFSATLPALGKNAEGIKYRLLAVNNAGQISKTTEFSVPVDSGESKRPSWQTSAGSGLIQVSTESEARAAGSGKKSGFSDTIALDVVESSARLMLVSGAAVAVVSAVGVGTGGTAAAVGGASAAAVGSGASAAGTTAVASTTTAAAATTTASTGTILGISSTTFWWIVAGVAAVAIGGAAVAASGGGGGGGGGGGAGNAGNVKVKW